MQHLRDAELVVTKRQLKVAYLRQLKDGLEKPRQFLVRNVCEVVVDEGQRPQHFHRLLLDKAAGDVWKDSVVADVAAAKVQLLDVRVGEEPKEVERRRGAVDERDAGEFNLRNAQLLDKVQRVGNVLGPAAKGGVVVLVQLTLPNLEPTQADLPTSQHQLEEVAREVGPVNFERLVIGSLWGEGDFGVRPGVRAVVDKCAAVDAERLHVLARRHVECVDNAQEAIYGNHHLLEGEQLEAGGPHKGRKRREEREVALIPVLPVSDNGLQGELFQVGLVLDNIDQLLEAVDTGRAGASKKERQVAEPAKGEVVRFF